MAAQKWLAYGQTVYQGADKPRRRHSTAYATSSTATAERLSKAV